MKINKWDLKYIIQGLGIILGIFSIPNVQLQILFSMSFVFILTSYLTNIEIIKFNKRLKILEEKILVGGKNAQ